MPTRTLLPLLFLAGCSWGHGERLAYDSLAREAIDAAIVEKARTIAIIAKPKAEVEPEEADPDSAAVVSLAGEIEDLADQGVHRARTLQLYYGAPQDLEVELDSPKDQHEIVCLAGLAGERQARRLWWKRLPKKLAEGVAGFAANFAGTAVDTVVERLIPTWLLWCLAVAIVVAIVILLYALYQRLVVVRRKDKAIVEYDEAIERLPQTQRGEIGKGTYLQLEHIRINDRRKAELRRLEDSILPLGDTDPRMRVERFRAEAEARRAAAEADPGSTSST